MIKPALQGDSFLADVRAAAADHLHLWWLGQSGFLLKWREATLLLDPYLSDSLTKKYAGTQKPHVRMTERVIEPAQLDFIAAVTSSHNHTDHLDAGTLLPLLEVNPALNIIVPRANLAFAAERLGTPVQRLTPISAEAEPVKVGPYTIFAIPSAHETLETDSDGEHKYLGYIIQVDGWTIYHSGDCVPYEGLSDRLKKWPIDLALLPINGRDPARGVAGNFTAAEAVALGREIQARRVIPCHYEMFEFNTVSPEAFVQHAQTAGVSYCLLRAGQRYSFLPH